ncbi:MAG: ribulose-phosphate 3-epimerase [Lentisphaerae bacterium]|mgnify:FL=1|jgi:ribulose-phosphate 3-epimerase|nr:ribulose-phosphate 3-epimerase [Lentisphaerota bacterium]
MFSADFGRLADGARLAERSGADELHLDVMDGHFVPNLSFGPDVVASIRRAVEMPLDVHLMLTHPDRFVKRFVDAGANSISIHIEASCDVNATLTAIRTRGLLAGLVLKPATQANALRPYLGNFDYVLCMTVEPGYGGQTFMADMLPKIRQIRQMSDAAAEPFPIMVDGGIGNETAAQCAAAGATQFVAGSSLYSAPDMAAAITAMRAATEAARTSGIPVQP